MGKLLPLLLVLALLGTARCYTSDPEAVLSGVPVVGAMVSPGAAEPGYVEAIGTPAVTALPESDLTTWFTVPEGGDPYDVATWAAIDAFAGHSGTPAHWTEACMMANIAAGSDRAANPKIGALACSSDGSVTQIQGFAADLVAAQARTALFIKGAPGSSPAAIEAKQAEIRLACGFELVARSDGADSPYSQACAKASDASYKAGDAPATFVALGEAYDLIATEIARLDPTIDEEPGFFQTAAE